MNILSRLCNCIGILTNTNVFVYSNCEEITLQYNTFSIIDNFKLTSKNITNIKEEILIKRNSVITLEKHCDYSVFYLGVPFLKDDLFFIIGPFLLKDPYYEKKTELFNLKKNHCDKYDFYINLKKVKTISTDILYLTIYNLINSNFKEVRRDTFLYDEVMKNKDSTSKNINITCEDIELTNKRYEYENLKLKYIKLGDYKNAIKYHNLLMPLCDLSQRLPNNIFRSLKNGLFISSGMTRKVVEELNIPPTLIHNLSSKIFSWIEQASTINELRFLDSKIIEEYSKLCLFHSEKYCNFSKNIKKALLFIEINKNEDISLVSVSDFVGLNVEYFSRLFKKEVGLNFKDYIMKLKINLAIEYLKKESYKSSEIAKKLGYSSLDSFSKAFKKSTGYTPCEYKKIKLVKKNLEF